MLVVNRRANLTRLSGISVLGCVATLCGCSADNTADSQSELESTSSVEIDLTTMPASTQCLRVVAIPSSGSATTKTFPLPAGTSSVNQSMGALRPSDYTFTGEAFSVACSSIGSSVGDWIADAVPVTVRAGVTSSVTLIFRKNNPTKVTANFVNNITGIALGSGSSYIATEAGMLQAGSISNSSTFQRASFAAFDSSTVSGNAVAAVAATTSGACAIRVDGTIWCWGFSNFGELGPGVAISSATATPVQVAGLSSAKLIVAGNNHVCALATGSSGTGVYCWGDNMVGQLGNGTTSNSGVQTPVCAIQTGGNWGNVKGLAAGSMSTYAIRDIGDLVTWGSNSRGQLGDGTTTNSSFPRYGIATAIQQVFAGSEHACTLSADGTLKCWGYNYYGQVGDGTTTNRMTPTTIALQQVKQVAAGRFATCALTTAGQTFCWGVGSNGAIGDGTGQTRLSPTAVKLGAVTLTSLAAGTNCDSTCGVASTLDVYCWGPNQSGQLGDGTTNTAFAPIKSQLQ